MFSCCFGLPRHTDSNEESNDSTEGKGVKNECQLPSSSSRHSTTTPPVNIDELPEPEPPEAFEMSDLELIGEPNLIRLIRQIRTPPVDLSKPNVKVMASPFLLEASKYEVAYKTGLLPPVVTPEEAKVLKCPTCPFYPQGPIYCCRREHSFCSDCARNLKQCPFCDASFAKKIRNVTLEEFLDRRRYQCPFMKAGCRQEPMHFHQMALHQFRCHFHPNATKICSLRPYNPRSLCPAYPCPYSFIPEFISRHQNEAEANRLIDHLLLWHQFSYAEVNLPETTTCKVIIANLCPSQSSQAPPKVEIFSNVIIRVNQVSGNVDRASTAKKCLGLYLILFRVDDPPTNDEYPELMGENKLFSVNCARLTRPPRPPPPGTTRTLSKRKDGEVEFTIRTRSITRRQDISWTDQPLNLNQLKELMALEPEARPCWKCPIPFSFLQTKCMRGQSGPELTIFVDFTRTHAFEVGKIAKNMEFNNNHIVEPRPSR